MDAENRSCMRSRFEETQSDETQFDETPPEKKTYTQIPPSLLSIIGGSLALYIIVGWLAYSVGTDSEFVMLIATVFAVVAIGAPALLAFVSLRRSKHSSTPRVRTWLHGFFDTCTGALRAREALVQVLLPITATAVGFTLIAIVLLSVSGGAPG